MLFLFFGFVLFLCFASLCLILSVPMKIIVLPTILVLFNVHSILFLISVSGSCSCFVCFLFQDVPLFLFFFCLLSCLF